MTDQQFVIELGDDQRATVEPDDSAWLRDKLRQEPGSTRVRMRYDQDDTEGHRVRGGILVRVIAESDDTEGHAISIHFPTREEADAFRKRLLVTGVIAGTIALGAAGGVGLANLTSGDAGTAGAAQTTVTGSDWTQMERQAAPAAEVPGSDWTQMERPAAPAEGATGSAWTQDERPGTATSSDDASTVDDTPSLGGPTPR